MNELTFFQCETCGNLVYRLNEGKGQMVCCGQPMTKLVPGSVDASQEKHVPALKREGNKLHVVVGAVEHPMTEKHYIQWIATVQGSHVQFRLLTPEDKPTADFTICEGSARVYAFCNLHGLWTAEA